MQIDYKTEAKKLKEFEGTNFFKPEAGNYQILVLEEPQLIEKEFDGEKKEQLRITMEVNREDRFIWDISKGQTTNSIYGQLMLVGENKGKLKEEVLTLFVKRANNKNDYTILEALPLMNKEGEKVED